MSRNGAVRRTAAVLLALAGWAPAARARRLRYLGSESHIHAEGETGTPVEAALTERGEALLRGLAATWWEDNPPWRRARLWLPFGGAVAAAVVLWFALRGRRVQP